MTLVKAAPFRIAPKAFDFQGLSMPAIARAQKHLVYDFEINPCFAIRGRVTGLVDPEKCSSVEDFRKQQEKLDAGRAYQRQEFVPLHGSNDFPDMVSSLNPVYYQARGEKMYDDFTTHGNGFLAARADVEAFAQHLAETKKDGADIPDKLAVVEFGGSNAKSAQHFFESIRIHVSPIVSSLRDRVAEYWIIDFCDPKKIEGQDTEKIKFLRPTSLCPEIPTALPIGLVRSSEFYTDLPFQHIIYHNRAFYESWFRFFLETAPPESGLPFPGQPHIKHEQEKLPASEFLEALSNYNVAYFKDHTYQPDYGNRRSSCPLKCLFAEFKYLPIGDISQYPFSRHIEELIAAQDKESGSFMINYAAIQSMLYGLGLIAKNKFGLFRAYDYFDMHKRGDAFFLGESCARSQFYKYSEELYPYHIRAFPGKITNPLNVPLIMAVLKGAGVSAYDIEREVLAIKAVDISDDFRASIK